MTHFVVSNPVNVDVIDVHVCHIHYVGEENFSAHDRQPRQLFTYESNAFYMFKHEIRKQELPYSIIAL